jgi:hypothetical protein
VPEGNKKFKKSAQEKSPQEKRQEKSPHIQHLYLKLHKGFKKASKLD